MKLIIKNKYKLSIFLTSILIFTSLGSVQLKAQSLEELRLIKTSPIDGIAVINLEQAKKMRIIKIGDQVGKLGIVSHISENRLVLEQKKPEGNERIIISLIDGKQTISRISLSNNDDEVIYVPQIIKAKSSESKDSKNKYNSME